MRNKMKRFKWFTIMEYEKEAAYLREMHKAGWKLNKVGLPGIYHFVRCQPEDVVYQLDYSQEGRAYKGQYIQMFSDCGWEYLFDFVGYSYFRKKASAMSGNEEIFCDDDSRLDMMKRVFKGRMIPIIILFFCVIIPQIIMLFAVYDISMPLRIFYLSLYSLLLITYLIIFVKFGVQFSAYKKR